jgi:hypothetical protein
MKYAGLVELPPCRQAPQSSVAYRKYSIWTRNSSYKKRVTWFNSEPVIATAIVEYIGEYVPSVVHGNACSRVGLSCADTI